LKLNKTAKFWIGYLAIVIGGIFLILKGNDCI